MQLTLRRAARREASEIAELFLEVRRVSMAYLPAIRTEAETHRWVEGTLLAEFDVWVAEAGGRIAAFMALKGEHLEYLYVLPGYQRRRIGDRLLAKAKDLSRRRLEFFVFAENAAAMAFYEARGCVAVRPVLVPEEEVPGFLYEWRAGRARGASGRSGKRGARRAGKHPS